MKFLVWLIVLLLAAVGAAAIVDCTGVYNVPMIEVTCEKDASTEEEAVVEDVAEDVVEEVVVEEVVEELVEVAEDEALEEVLAAE